MSINATLITICSLITDLSLAERSPHPNELSIFVQVCVLSCSLRKMDGCNLHKRTIGTTYIGTLYRGTDSTE
jgi:hypothetical protein